MEQLWLHANSLLIMPLTLAILHTINRVSLELPLDGVFADRQYHFIVRDGFLSYQASILLSLVFKIGDSLMVTSHEGGFRFITELAKLNGKIMKLESDRQSHLDIRQRVRDALHKATERRNEKAYDSCEPEPASTGRVHFATMKDNY
ncbi:hypothetical protein FQN53_002819 [Emmonsiellopsis sp. PD_33]|nr:hypothetical protein FQN53_002819 [Emmonsiellopsis sp. PD_33]